MAFDLNKIVRENVKGLIPYSSARGEYTGSASIFLDANENSFGSPISENYSRYPDPQQIAIKKKVAELNGVERDQVFIGNGSDEAIDLLIRVFCRPGIDNILICPPTYGMYEVAAQINDVTVKLANLMCDFALDSEAINSAIDEDTKLIFLCSPNNPTGNSLSRNETLRIAEIFEGIVVVDEAYIHFSDEDSLISDIDNFPNLVVLQTFSKAWGLAGLRVGLAFAIREIIDLLNKIKPPYNVSQIAQEKILEALENQPAVKNAVAEIKNERIRLAGELQRLPFTENVYPSEANFLLVKVANANSLYRFLVERQIIVRNRSNVDQCEGCLRITVGTPTENNALIAAMAEYQNILAVNV
ncbi:MAG TPA: histidinol-phosphate transaminase [Pyrinomonadaceae bacterium]|jgi:histidinol-phosphate aminotransferase|nr:histidinol-phosphate transaminase [Pyrinomonadaceae bacterium]